MAFDIENPVGTGTDAELLEFTRAAIAEVTLHGFMRQGRGKMLTKSDLSVLQKQVEWLESRIASAEGGGNAVNYPLRRRPG
jgi:hypothetical protein